MKAMRYRLLYNLDIGFNIKNHLHKNDILTDKNEDLDNMSRGNVVRLIDSFIKQMRQTRKTLPPESQKMELIAPRN
jgi:hypothetical protein